MERIHVAIAIIVWLSNFNLQGKLVVHSNKKVSDVSNFELWKIKHKVDMNATCYQYN